MKYSDFPYSEEQVLANAAFICKAVNNYDSLLRALRMFRASYSISKTGRVIINTQKHIDATQFCEEAIKKDEQ